MANPDEAVEVTKEVPSKAIAEAELRHEQAKGDDATPQEKKQAAVEQAHALSTRPQGSYAQLHETEEATLAVPDTGHLKEVRAEEKRQADADKAEVAASSKAATAEAKASK